jgi:hypothetical protein|tara:strand:- start:1257 stop:3005 length:1749 start_codon:yes stop_codon:yes gene_type:complete
MKVKLLTILVALLVSVPSNADNITVQIDTPNPGDTTTITTYSTGTAATTNNLISQNWIDGSWNGTMFPDSSDIQENIYLTGKEGKYAETTWNSQGTLSDAEIQQGFTSNFGAKIRWWNPQESTVTMTQTATDNNGNITKQSIILEDTTNHNYQFNDYKNTLIVQPDSSLTQGTITARFEFDILGNVNYNGGHAGVDVTDPSLILNYTTLSETTTTSVVYCYQKTPPTCPGQDEIEFVEDIIETISDEEWKEEFYDPYEETNIVTYDTDVVEYNWEDDWEADWQEEENYETSTILIDEYTYYEPEVLEFEEDFKLDESVYIEEYEELPTINMVYEEPIEEYKEEFNTEEIIDDYIEEPIAETQVESEETFEEIVMVEEPSESVSNNVIEEQPIEENIVKEEVVEEVVEEEIIEEEIEVVEKEESNSEELITDEPIQETDNTQQEEVIETDVEEQPNTETNIKIVKIEEYINSKVKNELQRIEATLTVVSEVISREMISNQADISSYANINAALFDSRQLADGNENFFTQIVLVGYDKNIYTNQVSMSKDDPIVKHTIELNKARTNVNNKYRELQELIDARNNI